MSSVLLDTDDHGRDRYLSMLLPPDGAPGNPATEVSDVLVMLRTLTVLARDEEDHALIAGLADAALVRVESLRLMLNTIAGDTAQACAELVRQAELGEAAKRRKAA